ncbi:Chorismate mutase 2 [Asimina triloba]
MEPDAFSLGTVRQSLIREEDTIVFCLIERAKFPRNPHIYEDSKLGVPVSGSFLKFFVQESEILQAKAGRYEDPVELPFFPDGLPTSLLPPPKQPQGLHPAAIAASNISAAIWNAYVNEALPLFTHDGDDGNYALTAAADLACLQALSRRIHYGMYVAEVKFRGAPQDYVPAIQSQDREALMKLLTDQKVEEQVGRRVEKKAMTFCHEVRIKEKPDDEPPKYKIDPSAAARLYTQWIIPLTKVVEVDYLLHRLH